MGHYSQKYRLNNNIDLLKYRDHRFASLLGIWVNYFYLLIMYYFIENGVYSCNF